MDRLNVRPVGARADNGALEILVDVDAGRESPVESKRPRLLGEKLDTRLRQRQIIGRRKAERALHAGEDGRQMPAALNVRRHKRRHGGAFKRGSAWPSRRPRYRRPSSGTARRASPPSCRAPHQDHRRWKSGRSAGEAGLRSKGSASVEATHVKVGVAQIEGGKLQAFKHAHGSDPVTGLRPKLSGQARLVKAPAKAADLFRVHV